jgi:hypothetical protein
MFLRSGKLGRVHEPILNPSFISYNVSRAYGLKWAVEFDVLGPDGQRVGADKVKGEVKEGGIVVRGCVEGVREGLLLGQGQGDGAREVGVGEMGLVDYEELMSGRVRDDDDEDEGDLDEGGSGSGGEKGGEGRRGDKEKKGLWRRSHDGKRREKEEYAAEDRARARAEEALQGGEQLPRYEA